MKASVAYFVRRLRGLWRPSKTANLRRLRRRGEDLSSLVFRDATISDVPALTELHVTTWNATYPRYPTPPTYQVREAQWRAAFGKPDGWFCVVIENTQGKLVGFAKGIPYAHPEQPDYDGELSKIYLLWEYHRLGLGRRLIGHVARRFLAQGVSSMLLFAEGNNPSCGFYEALGAEPLRDSSGNPSPGHYGWPDLSALAARCPVEHAEGT